MTILIISVTTLTIASLLGCLGFFYHMRSTEEKTAANELRGPVSQQIVLLKNLLSASLPALEGLEKAMDANDGLLRSGSSKNLMAVRRVIVAIEQRIAKLLALLQQGDLESLNFANEVINKPLGFGNSSLDTIAGNEIPNIAVNQLDQILSMMLTRLEEDISSTQRVA